MYIHSHPVIEFMVCVQDLAIISHLTEGMPVYHLFFQTPEEQRSWLYDAYYQKERYSVLATWDCSVVITIFMCNNVYVANPLLSLFSGW